MILGWLDVADKVKKKYGSLGHSVLAVQLERGRQGLGLSLAGHKDRNRMAVFVCGLNPNGAASRSGGIQVGDEILEVRPQVILLQFSYMRRRGTCTCALLYVFVVRCSVTRATTALRLPLPFTAVDFFLFSAVNTN
jgi:hypothetical protein